MQAISPLVPCGRRASHWLPLSFLLLLVGCAQSVPLRYLPDESQRVRIDPAPNLSEANKAIVEFTTNTIEPATFLHKRPTQMCDGFRTQESFSVIRSRAVSEEEEKMQRALAIATPGLTRLSDPRNDRTPHKVIKEYEAGHELIFHASTASMGGNLIYKCGPLRIKFRPEGGKHDRVDMIREANVCLLSLLEIREDAPPVVPAHSRWRCTPSLLGFDGNNVVGFQEFEAH